MWSSILNLGWSAPVWPDPPDYASASFLCNGKLCYIWCLRRSINSLRLLLFQILQISFQIVVGSGFGLEIRVDLANLFRDDVGNVAERLLRWVLGQIPLETGDVGCQVIWQKVGKPEEVRINVRVRNRVRVSQLQKRRLYMRKHFRHTFL